MITKGNAIAISILKISELFGKEYMKKNFNKACHSYPDNDNMMFDYFCGFVGDHETNLWLEFAYVRVNLETKEAIFLDYKLPNGERMINPIQPIRLA